MRLKALAEIYTMHSFAQLQNHIFFKKISRICQNLRNFSEILRNSQFFKPIFCENFEIAAVQKDANLVELEKCCQTHIFLQNFVLIQPRTSPPKICKLLLIRDGNQATYGVETIVKDVRVVEIGQRVHMDPAQVANWFVTERQRHVKMATAAAHADGSPDHETQRFYADECKRLGLRGGGPSRSDGSPKASHHSAPEWGSW